MGATVVIFLTIGLIGTIRMFSGFSGGAAPDPGLGGIIVVNNMIYLVSLALLVVQLARSGTRAPNHFGEEPRRP